jgi:hypothetical protein
MPSRLRRGEIVLDWIGTVVTGTVGVVGILATYRSGTKARIAQSKNLKLSINAEDNRNKHSEKRRIYASFIASAGSYVVVERALAVERDKGSAEDRIFALRCELKDAMGLMFKVLAEVRLIAPENVVSLAVDAVQRLIRSNELAREFPEIRDKLYEVMRADLGEPAHGHIHAPELAAEALER